MQLRSFCQFTRDEDDDKTTVAVPSLALKLGHSMKKCAQIYRGVGLREKDEEIITNTKNFLELMEFEWSDRISSSSLSTLEKKKANKVEMIPLTSDLEVLRNSCGSKDGAS